MAKSGYDTAIASAFSIVTNPWAVKPTAAIAKAIRWSPAALIVPEFSTCPPATANPSGYSSTSTPRLRKAAAVVAMRSLSFTRSSDAPLISTPSSVIAPSAAIKGNSSMRPGTMSASITPPVRTGPTPRTVKSATGSPHHSSIRSIWMSAPQSTRRSTIAARVGFIPTPGSRSRLPSNSVAPTSQYAADEISPGIRPLIVPSGPPCWIVTRPPNPSVCIATSAPMATSRSSEWSRVRQPSTTVVGPSA